MTTLHKDDAKMTTLHKDDASPAAAGGESPSPRGLSAKEMQFIARHWPDLLGEEKVTTDVEIIKGPIDTTKITQRRVLIDHLDVKQGQIANRTMEVERGICVPFSSE